MSRRKGSLLIFAIWVLVLFAVLSAALYRIISAQINVAKALEERLISQYLAKAAYAYARRQVLLDDTDYDTLCELGKEEEIELGRGKIVYRIADEQAKININAQGADGPKKELLVEIFSRLPGIEEGVDRKDVGEAIVAYSTDPNEKDRYFQVKEEILLIEEITEEDFNQFKDYITVYGNGAVNINTVSEEVLSILGMSSNLISIIKEYRLGSDGEQETEDDGVFTPKDNIVGKLPTLYVDDNTCITELVTNGLLGASSDTYCLEVNTTVFNRPAMRYNIVFDKEGIKRWQEY